MKGSKPLVGIVMGSDSDRAIMEEAGKTLSDFEVAWELKVCSAHRSPERTAQYARKAEERGIEVIIAGAGGAAHLAGVLAAHTILPVIGIPLEGSLNGLDSLLATVQMPAGVPVATMAIGQTGARNGAVLAVQILAGKHEQLKASLRRYKGELEKKVEEQDQKIAGEKRQRA